MPSYADQIAQLTSDAFLHGFQLGVGVALLICSLALHFTGVGKEKK